jgi:hypothetical protein
VDFFNLRVVPSGCDTSKAAIRNFAPGRLMSVAMIFAVRVGKVSTEAARL